MRYENTLAGTRKPTFRNSESRGNPYVTWELAILAHMVEGPLLTRKQMGRMLRELRLRSGKTVDDIECAADIMKKSKLYAIEAGKQPKPSWPEIQELAKFLGADTALVNELARMARACLVSGWYVPFDIDQRFQSYLELEGSATMLCFCEGESVNGLFQTEEYMRAMQRAGGLSDEKMRPHVDFRLQRLQRFWNRDPFPEVVLIMSEGALHREVGSLDVMSEQVAHLRELDERPNVKILVIPFRAGAHEAMHGKFTLLEFASGVYPEVAYVESPSECQYHERSAVVALYKRIWQESLRISVPIGEIQL